MLCSLKSFGQSPQAIPYQAVARDITGNLVMNQPISVRFTIHNATPGGSIAYQETQFITTNELGLFSLNIGAAGMFGVVNWSTGLKFLQVEMDPSGGNNFLDMGTQQMLSMPYSFYSDKSGTASNGVPNGTSVGQTMHWNGTAWISDDSFYNDGTAIGIPSFAGAGTQFLYIDNGGQFHAVTTIGIGAGGTGAGNATVARTNLSAAKSGANSDITSLSALSTPLSIGQGGTGWGGVMTGYVKGGNPLTAVATIPGSDVTGNISGNSNSITGILGIANGGTNATTAADARTNLGAAKSGFNSDITGFTNIQTPISINQGGTGTSSLGTVSAGSNKIFIGGIPTASVVHSFTVDVLPGNIDVNTLGGSPLTVAKGGTGVTSLTNDRILVGNGTGAIVSGITQDDGTSVGINAVPGFNATRLAVSGITLHGILGLTHATGAIGVSGSNAAAAGSGSGSGVTGSTAQSGGAGVSGYNSWNGGNGLTPGKGVLGGHAGLYGVGVLGYGAGGSNDAPVNMTFGVLGNVGNTGASSVGVCGFWGTPDFPTASAGVYGQSSLSTVAGVQCENTTGTTGVGLAVQGYSIVTGTKSAVVPTSKGYQKLYCAESPEVWFEDIGSGKIVNGMVKINLDPMFLETVYIDSEHPLHVFLQEEGESNGLIVIPGTTSFTVKEKNNGNSNISFSYRIIAKRKYYEDYRFGNETLMGNSVDWAEYKKLQPIPIDYTEAKNILEIGNSTRDKLTGQNNSTTGQK